MDVVCVDERPGAARSSASARAEAAKTTFRGELPSLIRGGGERREKGRVQLFVVPRFARQEDARSGGRHLISRLRRPLSGSDPHVAQR